MFSWGEGKVRLAVLEGSTGRAVWELWLTLKTSVGKMEGFWFEKDHMTYCRYLFPQFHYCFGAIHDSCFDLTPVFGLERYQ